MHLRRVNFALDDVQDRDVSTLLDGRRNENIFGLQQPPHNVEYCGLAHILLFSLVENQWRVTRHQEMAPRSRNQRRDEAHQIVVHVARVPQSRRRRRHDSRDDRVCLCKGRLSQLQSICRHSRQG